MKIKPYPGKIALIHENDSIEKDGTMDYESNWQECLQLWGPQNNHMNAAFGYTKTLDVMPLVDADDASTFEGSTIECTANGTVASHSFSYVNNLSRSQCASLENGDLSLARYISQNYDTYLQQVHTSASSWKSILVLSSISDGKVGIQFFKSSVS